MYKSGVGDGAGKESRERDLPSISGNTLYVSGHASCCCCCCFFFFSINIMVQDDR